MKSNLAYSFDFENVAYIGIGSNLGEKRGLCLEAIRMLEASPLIRLEARSSLYSSAPIGDPDQEWYVNAVVCVRTVLEAHELLDILQEIESALHRTRERRWGPRTIDLDLLFFNQEIIETPELRVPHPEAHHRSFVLRPLCEIAPQLIHPEFGCTVATLLKRLMVETPCFPMIPRFQPTNVTELR